MFLPSANPNEARMFAAEIVRTLRQAGHEAYWAGGCVRDELLGRIPADYDVATAAHPEIVRSLFGRRKTLAIGAAFGVITVLGPKAAGQVEVATFRTDADYTDGRHPAGVTFCSAREDAARRDFTINGMFLDPLSGEVHDFVGGRDDLAAGIVRAIGVPAQRFAEDHLRMLRAVRFAAGFGFALDHDTRTAIERMTHLVASVSPERISAELRAIVSRPGRGAGLTLLEATGLAREVLPEVAPTASDASGRAAWSRVADVVAALDEPTLPQAIAALCEAAAVDRPAAIAARLRLSNHEAKAIAWLHAGLRELGGRERLDVLAWSKLQPWVAHAHAPLLADLLRARASASQGHAEAAAWFTEKTGRPRAEIDPPPLVTGADLVSAGVPPGPAMGEALARIRQQQLDGVIMSPAEAIVIARAFASPS
jgi:poly(A) polymerase